METGLIYLLKVNLIISAFFLIYYIFLRKEKFLRCNRLFLLGAMVIALSLPLIPSTNLFRSFYKQVNFPESNYIHSLLLSSKSETIKPINALKTPKKLIAFQQERSFSFLQLFAFLYLSITFILFIRFGTQLFRLLYLIYRSSKHQLDGITYCIPRDDYPPLSFFNFIVIDKDKYVDNYDYIIRHEIAHCRQYHSIDVLLIEILHLFLWINPIVLLFKRHLKLNLEYLADEAAIAGEVDRRNYQYHILRNAVRPASPAFTNSFAASKLKQRIWMINRDEANSIYLLKYILVLPLVLSLYLLLQASGSMLSQKSTFNQRMYNSLTGYYQFITSKHVLIRITEEKGQLVLEQLWDNVKISFDKKSGLDFYNKERSFPLKFIKGGDGAINQLLAFDRDLWNKVDDYGAFVKQEIELPVAVLKEMEGYYQFQEQPRYLYIKAHATGLTVKEMWSNKEIVVYPESELTFFSKKGDFPMTFIRNDKGAITQALVFDTDLWHKVAKYKPLTKKNVAIPEELLNSYEGSYETRADWILNVKKVDGKLKVTVNGKEEYIFLPESQTKFYAQQDITTTMEFIKTAGGNIEKVQLMQEGIPLDARKIE